MYTCKRRTLARSLYLMTSAAREGTTLQEYVEPITRVERGERNDLRGKKCVERVPRAVNQAQEAYQLAKTRWDSNEFNAAATTAYGNGRTSLTRHCLQLYEESTGAY